MHKIRENMEFLSRSIQEFSLKNLNGCIKTVSKRNGTGKENRLLTNCAIHEDCRILQLSSDYL